MKICSKCQQEKPESEFNFKDKNKGTRKAQCRGCEREYKRQHYQNNRVQLIQKQGRINKAKRLFLARKVLAYLQEHPCVDCGESDPILLDFDHRDPKTKKLAISKMITSTYSWETVLAEIAKCDVRCVCCHRRRTARQQGFLRLLLLEGDL